MDSPRPQGSAVALRKVTKAFGGQTAVDELSLDVPEGSIYGFIGPNGSGKTTTLRMIMGIFAPDLGTIEVLGRGAAQRAAIDERVAYLPEERGLYRRMRVRETLEFHAALRSVATPKPEIDRWLGQLGLADHADKRVAELSKGMSQKVQFIATVLGAPTLVILDEPFSGLDPVNAVTLREAILELKKTATVIFSTHDMSVAEKMCDSIFMIHRGKKVLDGTLESIQDAYGEGVVRVRVDGASSLANLPGITAVNDFGKLQELHLASDADPQAVLAELMRRGRVRHFEVARPSLHDIFVRIAKPGAEVARA